MDTGLVHSFMPAANMAKGTRVKYQANETIVAAGADTNCIGCLDSPAIAGKEVAVHLYGPLRLAISATALAIGDPVTFAATGKVALSGTIAAAQWVAKSAATVDGDAVLLIPKEK